MSASDALGAQFRVDHETSDRGGVARAYRGSGEGQQWLGTMHYRTDTHPHGPTVENIQVDPSARRQGVASRLYDEVHTATGKPFVHHRDELSALGSRTVRALAARQPEAHRTAAYTRDGNPTSRAMRRR